MIPRKLSDVRIMLWLVVYSFEVIENFHIDPRCKKFINSLNLQSGAKVIEYLDLLTKYGPNLSMPYAKKISKNLYELRVGGSSKIRLFYAFYKGSVYVLHGFVKKTNKTPIKELKTAIKRFSSY